MSSKDMEQLARKATHRETESTRVFDELLRSRYSCRAYHSEPVDRSTIRRIVEIAQRTASWCNSQPWQLTIVEGPAIERLRDAYSKVATGPVASDIPFPESYAGVYKVRRRDTAEQLYGSLGIAMDDRASSGRQTMKNFRFFDAPHVAIITSPAELGAYGALDCGAFVSNFMTAAKSLGVAAIAQAAIAMQGRFLHTYLGIPDDRLIVCGISFGFSDEDNPVNGFRTKRAPIDDVIEWINA